MCVYVGIASNEDEDGVREFPQSCLWPHSVFTPLLFCVCAAVLLSFIHTLLRKRTVLQVHSRTASQTRHLKSNGMAEGQLTVLFLLFFSYNFVTQCCPQLEVKQSPNSNLLNTDGNYSKMHCSIVLH